jgi:Secretion system C-terminal sorting domain/von Willebrand factor type A domain
MRQLFTLIAIVSLLVSCNLDRKPSDKEIAVIVDSLRKMNIYVPPLYDKEVFDSSTTVKFFELAKATQGDLKLLVNSKLITAEIINIIKSNAENNADLLILMDKTGSMADDIVNVQQGLGQIIDVLKTFNNVRLGIALYGDKNVDGKDWFSFRNFETNYNNARDFINRIEVTGGGDYPESVYEGFFEACKQNFWRSENKRMIILIGDAPPLEKPLSQYKVTDVITKAEEDKIKMNFFPIVVTAAVGELATTTAPKTFENEKIVSNVYPNPVSGNISIGLITADDYSIEIFNSAGTPILGDKFSGNLWKRDISSFPNGPYIARLIRKDKKFEAVKFIVYK